MVDRIGMVDAVSGAPSYTGRALRQLDAVAMAGATAARPLGGVSGVRPGTSASTVAATSTTWTCGPFAGQIDAETAAEAGPYRFAFDAAATGAITAANASNPRIDIIYVEIDDPAESDGSTVPAATRKYLAGTAAASPTAPATPAQSMVIAQINVPKSGGSAPTVTWVAPYAGASGAISYVNTATQLPASANTGDRMQAYDTGIIHRFNGAAWKAWESDWISWTPTLSAGSGSFTVGNGTLTARYRWDGGQVRWLFRLLMGSTSSIGTNASFTLPLSAEAAISSYSVMGRGTLGVTNGSAIADGVCYRSNASQTVVVIGTWNVASTYPAVVGVTASVPFGWGAGCYIELTGSYNPA